MKSICHLAIASPRLRGHGRGRDRAFARSDGRTRSHGSGRAGRDPDPGTVAPDVVGKYHFGDVTLGGQATDVTGNSSKFTEYRGVPEGVLLRASTSPAGRRR
jgi:hypothetical protein